LADEGASELRHTFDAAYRAFGRRLANLSGVLSAYAATLRMIVWFPQRRGDRMKAPVLPVIVAALLGSGVAAGATVLAVGGGSDNSTVKTSSRAASLSSGNAGATRDVSTTSSSTLTATQVYQHSSSGVVQIRAVTASGEDLGTGIVLNNEGLILTNNHVVAGERQLVVSPGKDTSVTRAAKLVGQEANDDLALIKVDPSGLGLKPLKLVSSSSTQIGDTVYALGNPYGLDETLTKGIVSALGREIQAPDGAKITGAIQTDAALNPGNSGGPLLNQEGNVIGVNSQIASDQASVDGSQPGSTGVGFAISANTVMEAVKRIESGEGVTGESTQQTRQQEASAGSGSGRSELEGYGAEEGASTGGQGGLEGPVVIVP
jgi:putative serine protease PepD